MESLRFIQFLGFNGTSVCSGKAKNKKARKRLAPKNLIMDCLLNSFSQSGSIASTILFRDVGVR